MPAIAIVFLAAALAASPQAAALAAPPQAAAPLAIDVHSREIAPGEPLRIVVRPAVPVAKLEGSLFGTTFPLVQDGPLWIGWAVVDLDRLPGRYELVVAGQLETGKNVEATRALVVAKKVFPVQKLNVAPKYVEPAKAAQERIARERAVLDAIYARRSAAPGIEAPFVRPVAGDPTSAFGLRRVFNGKPRSPHSGLDLRAATGTPVKAAGPGVVAYAGDLYFSGRTVVIDHGAGLFTIYAHLSEIGIAEGAAVAAGDRLGLSGATGRVTGPHLHWGARIGEAIFDPRALMDARLFGSD